MKNQDEQFILKRDKVRKLLRMTVVCESDRSTLYQKIQGQQVNKKYNSPLNDKEANHLSERLQVVIDACQDLKDELEKED